MSVAPQPFVVRCSDGYLLQAVLYPPRRERRGLTVLVCPAMLVRRRYYRGFCAWLAEQGVRVLCFSFRGAGHSLAAETDEWDHRIAHWGERDIPAMIRYARESWPGDRLFLVGHSMGGQLAALSAAVHELRGIVTVAATAAWWGHWPFPENLGILGWYALVPFLGRALDPLPAERFGVGPDTRSTLVRGWVRWGRDRRYFQGDREVRSHLDLYRGRVLAYWFTDDPFGREAAVRALHDDYVTAELSYRPVAPEDLDVQSVGHFGFFSRRVGPMLWEEAMEWMEDRSSC